ncbi:hypothetical protein FHX44_11336 [Pseudonocardia hierapolitana]|uniref:Uncharacterized protein n=2 Tax=Pseudonocardia hierapolitana TaxID=1128676 RepID=A0A561SHU9_9PSEU|nr:hypothetical protein FHX44_11336 [Pseudonocardia hierapolitana]
MRLAGEAARMSDLQRLLPRAAAAGTNSRRVGLGDRLLRHQTWAQALAASEDGWTRLTDELARADALVDELVALLMTQLLRESGLAEGTFDAAEAFLDELVGLAGIPGLVLGQTQELESVDHTRASVAMRFPGARVWDLPFLAHEFGHHATATLRNLDPGLSDNRPLAATVTAVGKALADAGTSPARAEAHASELVADAVATLCCGATYPIACLCLRVPPVPAATQANQSHPAWTTRIAVTRIVLDALTEETKRAGYRQMRERVVDPLARTLLGRVPDASPAALEAARRTVRTVRRHRPGLVYGDVDAAIEVAGFLVRLDPVPPQDATVAAVVDGAWRWRLDRVDPADDEAVGLLVTRYCAAVVKRRSP